MPPGPEERYPPIGDYALLSDCHSCALVSRRGSIDWCCMPRLDSPSLFGRLLGWDEGGYFLIAPDEPYEARRRYREQSLILETIFTTAHGVARLVDWMPMRAGGRREPYRQLLRLVEGVEGAVPVRIEIVPRFDYGAARPWIRRAERCFHAMGANHGLVISSDVALEITDRHDLRGRHVLEAGQRRHASILHRPPEVLDEGNVPAPDLAGAESRLVETEAWWREWTAQGDLAGPDRTACLRSAVVLKGLSHAPTGALAAAATTSLPEAAGGSRNWDYRYTWVRDSVFAVRALAELGFVQEADGFRRFAPMTARWQPGTTSGSSPRSTIRRPARCGGTSRGASPTCRRSPPRWRSPRPSARPGASRLGDRKLASVTNLRS